MAILSDIYTPPTPEPEPVKTTSSRTATTQNGPCFDPAIGKCYKVHFGKVKLGAKTGFGSARIRVNGQSPLQWVDLDTNEPLDPGFGQYVVQEFEEIDCPNE